MPDEAGWPLTSKHRWKSRFFWVRLQRGRSKVDMEQSVLTLYSIVCTPLEEKELIFESRRSSSGVRINAQGSWADYYANNLLSYCVYKYGVPLLYELPCVPCREESEGSTASGTETAAETR